MSTPPKALRYNPLDHDIILEGTVEEDGEDKIYFVRGKIGESKIDCTLLPKEAELIGKWFLKFAQWAKGKK